MSTYSTPIPGVPQYGQAALAARTAYGSALARINQRRGSLLRSSGFAGDIDSESGVVRNVRLDGANKFGALQQLNRSQAMRDESARWAGIERGLGAGGGLAAQMRSHERYDFGRQDADLAQSLLESLSGLQDEQTQAAYGRDRALYEAELEAARMAIQAGDFNPTDFDPSGDGGSGVGAARATTSTASPQQLAAAHRATLARVKQFTPGTGNVNEAVRLANAKPVAKKLAPKTIEHTRIVNAVKAAQAASKGKRDR